MNVYCLWSDIELQWLLDNGSDVVIVYTIWNPSATNIFLSWGALVSSYSYRNRARSVFLDKTMKFGHGDGSGPFLPSIGRQVLVCFDKCILLLNHVCTYQI